jgi:hypothetical protein
VRVNAVAPTYINTPLNAFVKSKPAMYDAWIGGTPMGRLGEVDEVAAVVLFLASDAASLMTGRVSSSVSMSVRPARVPASFDDKGPLLAAVRHATSIWRDADDVSASLTD